MIGINRHRFGLRLRLGKDFRRGIKIVGLLVHHNLPTLDFRLLLSRRLFLPERPSENSSPRLSPPLRNFTCAADPRAGSVLEGNRVPHLDSVSVIGEEGAARVSGTRAFLE